jgi:hypothetical protein
LEVLGFKDAEQSKANPFSMETQDKHKDWNYCEAWRRRVGYLPLQGTNDGKNLPVSESCQDLGTTYQ